MTTIELTKYAPITLADAKEAEMKIHESDAHNHLMPLEGKFIDPQDFELLLMNRKRLDSQSLRFRKAHQHIWHTLQIEASQNQLTKYHRLIKEGYEVNLKTSTRANRFEFYCSTCGR